MLMRNNKSADELMRSQVIHFVDTEIWRDDVFVILWVRLQLQYYEMLPTMDSSR